MTIKEGGAVLIGGQTSPTPYDDDTKLVVWDSNNGESNLRIVGDGGGGSVVGKCGIAFRVQNLLKVNGYGDQGRIVIRKRSV